MEEIPIEVYGLSRAIFSTLLNYPVPNRNGDNVNDLSQ